MLLNRSGEFIAFGYDAEQIYTEARSREEVHGSDVTDSDEASDDVTEVEENSHYVEDLMLFKQFKIMFLNYKVKIRLKMLK